MDEEEESRISCSCKSTCKMRRTAKNENRGCPCKTEGVPCGNKCTCHAKLPCENKKPASTTVKSETAFAINISDNNNSHSSGALGFQSDSKGASRTVQQRTIQEEVKHASKKRKASEASTNRKEDKEKKSAIKCIKSEVVSGGESESDSEGASRTVQQRTIQEEASHASRKRKSSEASTNREEDDGKKSAIKCIKSEVVSGGESESASEAANGDFCTDVVFALDFSSSVTEEELKKEVDFAKNLAKSWNVNSGYSKAAFVAYGDECQTLWSFNPDNKRSSVKIVHKEMKNSKCRRMDLALKEAAHNLSKIKQRRRNQHQLVVLITAGKQLSNLKQREEEDDRLLSAAELLSLRYIKVIIVPVGLETDFKQLGLIVKRPQSLFPLSSFEELTPSQAKKIASGIKKTIDIDTYAKKQFQIVSFSGIPPDAGLWEKISLCSDVIEGAWYLLYDDLKKTGRREKVKSLIRESIDNFHNTLVSDSKVCISLAVFGPLGAGKSFFLNFLLNHGLSGEDKVENGPLPSASGGSQTPLPIYVKYGKRVQVLLHKQKKGESPDVWFSEEELGNGTLARVNNLLKEKFEKGASLSHVNCIELQGPFPVFHYLKERAMTNCGHLELEVDVEFVDVPGLGDETGNDSINIELSKADVVLFFDNSKSGRSVSSEDIAQIFRRRNEFEFTSRPKLVHVVNDRGETSSASSCNFDHLCEQKKKDLERAWSNFLPSSFEDEEIKPDCYQDVRKKLPQLNGEVLLEKLSQESEVVYFHTGNSGLIKSLKNVINDHVQNVKIKETIHPFLQKVHWAAKKLRTRIGKSHTTERRKSQPHRVKVKEDKLPNFQMLANPDQVSDFVSSLNIDHTTLQLQYDIVKMFDFLYNDFLVSEETVTFLLDRLKVSLENFRHRLIEHYKNENCSVSRDISELIDLGEMLSESRVQQYCTNSAPAYLLHVLEKGRNKNPFGKYKKRWSSASDDERGVLCSEFLYILLDRIMRGPLEKETRDQAYKKSHFHFMSQLKQDVKDLFTFGSLEDDASRLNVFKLLNKPIDIVIKFCSHSIREINPHPSLDVQADISLPERMKDAHEDSIIPLESSHCKIIKEMNDLLLKPATKGAEAIRKLESKLSLGKGALVPRQSQSADQQRSWAKVLVNILSDEDHFNIPLDPSLILDSHDPEVDKLLSQARKRLFAHEKSSVTCKIDTMQDLSDNEIHVKKGSLEEHCLEVWVSPKMYDNLDTIRKEFKDPTQQVAPIFMPTIRPGPTPDIRGNFFLEEDPWSKDERTNDVEEEDGNRGDGGVAKESKDLNIFLVVEKQHLETIQSTVDDLESPAERNIKLMYVVLPQKGRGIGVTRAIIKSLAECLKFSLYWTIDDDVQFMYQFDGNDRRWHKCSLVRGLLFGQRVFQTCQQKTVKKLSLDERHDLKEKITEKWPCFAKKTKRSAEYLLLDDNSFAKVQKNPGLLHSPFTNIPVDCDGDPAKEVEMKVCEQEFVDACRKRLFEEAVDHIAGVSIAHESTKRYDYTSKYPAADYMQSEQRYQVVLNNTRALKKRNFVTDEIIFHEEEFQIHDKDKRNTPYWGIRGSDKSFCHALTLGGVIGYQVIRVVHSHKKLTNVFDRVGPSYIGSQSPFRSEDEDEEDMDVNS
ncbi:uncharacterized protein LOC144631584 isoform X2 [Oculina patagonica]